MLYFLVLSVSVYILHVEFGYNKLNIPFTTIAALSTALAIFLGLKNNSAYERWREARRILGIDR